MLSNESKAIFVNKTLFANRKNMHHKQPFFCATKMSIWQPLQKGGRSKTVGGSVVNMTPQTFVGDIAQDIGISAVFSPNSFKIKTLYW